MSQRTFIIFSVLLDAVCIVGGTVLAYFVRFSGQLPAHNFNAFLLAAPFILCAYYIAGWIHDLYKPVYMDTPWSITRSTFLTTMTGALLTALILFLGSSATAAFARWTFLLSVCIIFTLFTFWRMVFLRVGSISWPTQRILILGTGDMALNLARNLQKYHEKHLELVGFVSMDLTDDSAHDELAPFAPLRGTYKQLPDIISVANATRLIVASPADSREVIETIALVGKNSIAIDIVPNIYEILLASTDSIVGDIPLIHATGKQLSGYARIPKRILDLVMSAIVALLGAPVMLIAALAIKLDDGGPVFYLQERVGKDGRLFRVVKFRTMELDAEKDSGPVLAEDGDVRITRVGKVLRTFRIDEMPQFLNVMRGRMSFIGPRPERPFFSDQYMRDIEGYDERLRVLPGITGLAQINGGYATTPELKLKYDLMYVYHQSFLLDLQVMAETIKVVLTGRGAR